MRHYNNPMYRRLQFTEHYHAERMTAAEVVNELTGRCGRRCPFFVNGKPFIGVKEDAESGRVVFRYRVLDIPENIAGWYWGNQFEAYMAVNPANIAGLEMVTVYCGKEYCGRFPNVLLRTEKPGTDLEQALSACTNMQQVTELLKSARQRNEITGDEMCDLFGEYITMYC